MRHPCLWKVQAEAWALALNAFGSNSEEGWIEILGVKMQSDDGVRIGAERFRLLGSVV
jgi:hypothetical protein